MCLIEIIQHKLVMQTSMCLAYFESNTIKYPKQYINISLLVYLYYIHPSTGKRLVFQTSGKKLQKMNIKKILNSIYNEYFTLYTNAQHLI